VPFTFTKYIPEGNLETSICTCSVLNSFAYTVCPRRLLKVIRVVLSGADMVINVEAGFGKSSIDLELCKGVSVNKSLFSSKQLVALSYVNMGL